MFGNPKFLWPSRLWQALVLRLPLICCLYLAITFVALDNIAAGEPLVVVTNPKSQINQLTKMEMKDILLGRKVFIENDIRIRVFLPELANEQTKAFIQTHTGMTSHSFLAYWRRRLFSGRGTPPVFVKSHSELIERVSNSEGGIGVVDPTEDRNTLSTILVIE